MNSETATEFGVWSADGHPLVVEYSRAVLEDIRVATVDGLHRLSRGGIEVGGVLFGERAGTRVRILAQRPIACEHSKGPCFVLSETDLAGLDQLLASAPGLAPAGWYHSHTRTGILLDDADIELFNRFFPLPWQVALVLHPEQFGPVTAGFFFREAHGQLRAGSSYREFEVAPHSRKQRQQPAEEPPPPTEVSRALEGSPLPARPPRPSTPPLKAMAPARPATGTGKGADARLGDFLKKLRPRRSRRRAWLTALGLCLLALLIGMAAWTFLFPPGKDVLALHVWDSESQLRIEWDRTSRPVRRADRATLEIVDGEARTEFPLDREQLGKGSLNYARRSADVAVRLKLYRAGAVLGEETTRFLGPPPAATGQTGPR